MAVGPVRLLASVPRTTTPGWARGRPPPDHQERSMATIIRRRSTARTGLAAAAVAAGVVGQALLAGPALAAGTTTVTKLELKGTELRIEGRTAGAGFVVVESTT